MSVFDWFTQAARRVVVLAGEEARLQAHSHIGTEHLILGVLAEPESAGGRALASLHVQEGPLRALIAEAVPPGSGSSKTHIPFTPRAKKVLEGSLQESRDLGDRQIGSEHILLSLVREREGVAAQGLAAQGIGYEDVRAAVASLPPAPGADPGDTEA